ncbi:MAG: tetratricopeptide repeat protein [Bacteroidota bacterium]
MKRILSVVILILVTAAASLFSQPQLDKAKDLVKQKKFTEAITVCQAYLQSSQKDENAWLLLAKALQQLGMLDSAENAAKKVVQLDDEMLEGYTVLAQVQLEKKNVQDAYATAKAGLKMIRKKQPKYPPLLVVLGQTLLAIDSADAALVVASEAKELDPRNATAYEVIGDAYEKQKVAPMAISSYESSLEIDSLQMRVLYKLANAYTKERQYTEAARVYNRVLSLDPNNEVSRLELARLFYRAKQWVNCAATLKDYFKKEINPPKDIRSMYLESLLRGRLYKEAAQVGQEFLKVEPKSPLAYRAIANGFFNEKKYAQAIENFKKVDTLEFDDYRWLGASYKQLKKDSLAAMTWEEGLKDSTQAVNVRSYYLDQVASTWMYLRSYERAAEFYQKRLQLDSTAVGAYINYAQCMMQLERFEKAVSALKSAIAKTPKFPPVYTNLGFCYFQMKEFDAGRKEFETAIKIIDTAESRYKVELADSYRMIGLSIMMDKKVPEEESKKKWEDAIVVLKKSLKYKEDVAQTHLLLGQSYQNSNKEEDAIREYKRTLQLDPKNKDVKKSLEILEQAR